jgi:hypothetical protein
MTSLVDAVPRRCSVWATLLFRFAFASPGEQMYEHREDLITEIRDACEEDCGKGACDRVRLPMRFCTSCSLGYQDFMSLYLPYLTTEDSYSVTESVIKATNGGHYGVLDIMMKGPIRLNYRELLMNITSLRQVPMKYFTMIVELGRPFKPLCGTWSSLSEEQHLWLMDNAPQLMTIEGDHDVPRSKQFSDWLAALVEPEKLQMSMIVTRETAHLLTVDHLIAISGFFYEDEKDEIMTEWFNLLWDDEGDWRRVSRMTRWEVCDSMMISCLLPFMNQEVIDSVLELRGPGSADWIELMMHCYEKPVLTRTLVRKIAAIAGMSDWLRRTNWCLRTVLEDMYEELQSQKRERRDRRARKV